jgi:hypothetical protein
MTRHALLAACIFLCSAPAGAKPTAKGPLPDVAKASFVSMLRGTGVIPDKGWVKFTTAASSKLPIKFDFKAGAKTGSGYATLYKGKWVFSTQQVTQKDLTTVTKAMVSYLKENFFPNNDETPAQIAKLCKMVRPERTFWKGETTDPYNLVGSYPMVFCMLNPTGSDHGFYVGYNPKTHTTEPYDFN